MKSHDTKLEGSREKYPTKKALTKEKMRKTRGKEILTRRGGERRGDTTGEREEEE